MKADPPTIDSTLTDTILRNPFAGIAVRNAGSLPSLKRRYLGMFILLMIVDALQTTRIVALFGSGAELNPIMRLAMEQFSISGLWLIKAVATLVVLLAVQHVRPVILMGSIVLMASVVTSNMLQMWMTLL